jgi:hypothetical protein
MTARSHIKGAEGSMRLDTHRPIQLEQSCAEEGGGWVPTRDRAPALPAAYWIVMAVAVTSFAIFIGWHVLASWGRA